MKSDRSAGASFVSMWLPKGFAAPTRVDLPVDSHHLRRISAADTELDMIAVMGSQERLATFVPQWMASDWPFEMPRYIGRGLSWQEWLALPDGSRAS